MKIDKTKITKEQLAKALECKTAEELMALAKAAGYDMTKEEAEAYLAEFANRELDRKDLDKVAGGSGTVGRQPCYGNSGCAENWVPI